MEQWKFDPARDHGLSMQDRWKSVRRESGLISTGLHIGWWSFVRLYMSIWHRLHIEGQENLPTAPPFTIVANHSSHLDAMVLGSCLPWRLRHRTLPIAAGDVFFHRPTIAAFAANFLNALPMWRKSCGPHAMKELRERLIQEPCGYILFPEGGRSRDGKLKPFKMGMGMLVAEANVAVIPCHLQGCFEALDANSGVPRRRPIRLRVGKALNFSSVRNNRQGWEIVTAETEKAIRALGGIS